MVKSMAARHLLHAATLLALLLASFGMLGGHAMAAARSAVTADAGGHCAGMDDGKKAPDGSSIDCAIACAALPSSAPMLDRASIPQRAAQAAPCVSPVRGLAPEADPPPPRFA